VAEDVATKNNFAPLKSMGGGQGQINWKGDRDRSPHPAAENGR